eukprot:TRINITY_DN10531_c0_g1_i3.p2 TRINITY_DN10531_c0_g1~~TRINITY_DN10531_c0_g1_i3.p2  ORF type:complete len:201 (+),score=35.38 TRINITY_DN10531_c0_g1_i3:60-662(+)
MSCWLCGHHCTSRSMAVTCLPERPRWSDLVDTSNDSFLQSPPRPLPLQDDSYREPLHPCELELGTESREGLVTHMQRSADLQAGEPKDFTFLLDRVSGQGEDAASRASSALEPAGSDEGSISLMQDSSKDGEDDRSISPFFWAERLVQKVHLKAVSPTRTRRGYQGFPQATAAEEESSLAAAPERHDFLRNPGQAASIPG